MQISGGRCGQWGAGTGAPGSQSAGRLLGASPWDAKKEGRKLFSPAFLKCLIKKGGGGRRGRTGEEYNKARVLASASAYIHTHIASGDDDRVSIEKKAKHSITPPQARREKREERRKERKYIGNQSLRAGVLNSLLDLSP